MTPILIWIPMVNLAIIVVTAGYSVFTLREALDRFTKIIDTIEIRLEDHEHRLTVMETTQLHTDSARAARALAENVVETARQLAKSHGINGLEESRT